MAVGKFEAYKSPKGKWRFRLKAGNGEIVCSGEEYETKQGCLKGIASIQRNSAKAPIVIIEDFRQKGSKDISPKQLVKQIIKEEKTPTEEISEKARNTDEKKVLVDPKGPKKWQPRKIRLPGTYGPRWM